METPLLSKRHFNRIRRFIPVRKHKNLLDDRKTLSGILFLIRYGLSWRHLPEFYGNWRSVYSKFRRWSKAGIIQKVFKALASRLPKLCIAMIDSSYVKAQRTASSLRSDGLPRALGRSKGGITTKIHLLCDEQGHPKDFIITAGQVADIKIAPKLVKRNKMTCLLADRAYDANTLRDELERRHIHACIPSKSNRNVKIQHDALLYRKRHVIENMFSRLKDWKGIAFRSNRCAHTYHSFVALALVILFL